MFRGCPLMESIGEGRYCKLDNDNCIIWKQEGKWQLCLKLAERARIPSPEEIAAIQHDRASLQVDNEFGKRLTIT